jgi:hypothetical protein
MLAEAVVWRSEALKNLQEAVDSRDTVLANIDIQARKVEIERTQQMLQEAQKAHNKAIAKTYKQLRNLHEAQKAHNKAIAETYEQLRNLLSGDAQSQWDRVCCEMHERNSWAGVNGQVTEGRRPQT